MKKSHSRILTIPGLLAAALAVISLITAGVAFAASADPLTSRGDLIQTLEDAAEGDTLSVGDLDLSTAAESIEITKSVTISGASRSSPAVLSDAVFAITGPEDGPALSVTFSHICFCRNTSGTDTAEDLRPAFTLSGNLSVSFDSCSFSGYTGQNGGAVSALYSDEKNRDCSLSLSFTSCSFLNNQAEEGGALYLAGYGENIELTVSDCTFENNGAASGGAIRASEVSGTVTGTLFSSQQYLPSSDAELSAGGAACVSSGRLVFRDCKFLSNVSFNGGALALEATRSRVENCVFTENTALNEGAAFLITTARSRTAYITNCSVYGNISAYGNAASVYREDPNDEKVSDAVFTFVTFLNNRVTDGASVALRSQPSTNFRCCILADRNSDTELPSEGNKYCLTCSPDLPALEKLTAEKDSSGHLLLKVSGEENREYVLPKDAVKLYTGSENILGTFVPGDNTFVSVPFTLSSGKNRSVQVLYSYGSDFSFPESERALYTLTCWYDADGEPVYTSGLLVGGAEDGLELTAAWKLSSPGFLLIILIPAALILLIPVLWLLFRHRLKKKAESPSEPAAAEEPVLRNDASGETPEEVPEEVPEETPEAQAGALPDENVLAGVRELLAPVQETAGREAQEGVLPEELPHGEDPEEVLPEEEPGEPEEILPEEEPEEPEDEPGEPEEVFPEEGLPEEEPELLPLTDIIVSLSLRAAEEAETEEDIPAPAFSGNEEDELLSAGSALAVMAAAFLTGDSPENEAPAENLAEEAEETEEAEAEEAETEEETEEAETAEAETAEAETAEAETEKTEAQEAPAEEAPAEEKKARIFLFGRRHRKPEPGPGQKEEEPKPERKQKEKAPKPERKPKKRPEKKNPAPVTRSAFTEPDEPEERPFFSSFDEPEERPSFDSFMTPEAVFSFVPENEQEALPAPPDFPEAELTEEPEAEPSDTASRPGPVREPEAPVLSEKEERRKAKAEEKQRREEEKRQKEEEKKAREEAEKAARAEKKKLEEDYRRRQEEERQRLREEARQRALREAAEKQALREAALKKAEEEARRKAAEEARLRALEEDRRKAEAEALEAQLRRADEEARKLAELKSLVARRRGDEKAADRFAEEARTLSLKLSAGSDARRKKAEKESRKAQKSEARARKRKAAETEKALKKQAEELQKAEKQQAQAEKKALKEREEEEKKARKQRIREARKGRRRDGSVLQGRPGGRTPFPGPSQWSSVETVPDELPEITAPSQEPLFPETETASEADRYETLSSSLTDGGNILPPADGFSLSDGARPEEPVPPEQFSAPEEADRTAEKAPEEAEASEEAFDLLAAYSEYEMNSLTAFYSGIGEAREAGETRRGIPEDSFEELTLDRIRNQQP